MSITFRGLTIAVFALWLVTLGVSLWLISHSEFPPAEIELYRTICPLARSPFVSASDLVLAGLAFWIVHRWRERNYLAALFVYGMFLGNVLGLFEVWILCRQLFG